MLPLSIRSRISSPARIISCDFDEFLLGQTHSAWRAQDFTWDRDYDHVIIDTANDLHRQVSLNAVLSNLSV